MTSESMARLFGGKLIGTVEADGSIEEIREALPPRGTFGGTMFIIDDNRNFEPAFFPMNYLTRNRQCIGRIKRTVSAATLKRRAKQRQQRKARLITKRNG